MTTQHPESLPDTIPASQFKPDTQKRYAIDTVFQVAAWTATVLAILVLITLVTDVALDGLPRLSWSFLTSFPSRRPAEAGLLSALVGTICLLFLVATVAFPIGVGAGIFLEEFARKTVFDQIIEINIANLAGVPSIIYGLLGLELFVRVLSPVTGGRSLLAGALTLSLLVLPIIIVSTREALRAVPDSLRQAGFALGTTRWQVVRDQVLPIAMPGILTGTILALSRAIGETAPLIMIGALTFISFLPDFSPKGLQSPFTALPIQVFNWVSRPQTAFHVNAAAGILVLIAVLLAMNATAIFLRNKFQQTRL